MSEENTPIEGITSTNNPIEGVSTSAPIHDTPPVDNTEPTFLDSLPENLRTEKAFSNVKSIDDLANQFLNAQKMIGKKTIGIPDSNSSDEEVNSFYEKLRPETHEAYNFDTEHLPEGIERDTELDNKVKEIFHNAGLSEKQAQMVVSEYEKLTHEMNPILTPEQKEQAFEKRGRELLGNEYESVLDNAMKVSAELVPDNVKDIVKEFNDDQLLAFASTINNIKSKFMSEDTSGNSASPAPQGMSDADRREQSSRLLAEMDKVGPLSPRYEELNRQRKALYK